MIDKFTTLLSFRTSIYFCWEEEHNISVFSKNWLKNCTTPASIYSYAYKFYTTRVVKKFPPAQLLLFSKKCYRNIPLRKGIFSKALLTRLHGLSDHTAKLSGLISTSLNPDPVWYKSQWLTASRNPFVVSRQPLSLRFKKANLMYLQ